MLVLFYFCTVISINMRLVSVDVGVLGGSYWVRISVLAPTQSGFLKASK